MRYQDLVVLAGVVTLAVFCIYAAVVGSEYNESTTPLQRLLQSMSEAWEPGPEPARSSAGAGKGGSHAASGPTRAGFKVVQSPGGDKKRRPPPAAQQPAVANPPARPPEQAKPQEPPAEEDEEPVF